jgi:hypothetical protein
MESTVSQGVFVAPTAEEGCGSNYGAPENVPPRHRGPGARRQREGVAPKARAKAAAGQQQHQQPHHHRHRHAPRKAEGGPHHHHLAASKPPRAAVFGLCGDEFLPGTLPACTMPPVPCDDVPSAPHWLGRNVYVRRLPPVSGAEMPSEIHVYNLFSRFGRVERLRVLRDHATHLPLGSALVLFAEPRAASLAVQCINAGVVPGAVADFWLPRALINNTPTARRGSPPTGWTSPPPPPPESARASPAPFASAAAELAPTPTLASTAPCVAPVPRHNSPAPELEEGMAS